MRDESGPLIYNWSQMRWIGKSECLEEEGGNTKACNATKSNGLVGGGGPCRRGTESFDLTPCFCIPNAQLDDMVAGTGTANLDKFFEDVENVLTEDMKSCREALQSIAISQQGMVQ
ncbi:hypothetical protein V6N11_005984 [Hibiscus sabdariffa]|uniref:Uncharacterized protein n=1 Tax=Hibiscus sabdariffa TaxID=183260 RepID=A0ABR2RPC4_9ROSI